MKINSCKTEEKLLFPNGSIMETDIRRLHTIPYKYKHVYRIDSCVAFKKFSENAGKGTAGVYIRVTTKYRYFMTTRTIESRTNVEYVLHNPLHFFEVSRMYPTGKNWKCSQRCLLLPTYSTGIYMSLFLYCSRK